MTFDLTVLLCGPYKRPMQMLNEETPDIISTSSPEFQISTTTSVPLSAPPASLVFKVRRSHPELIVPAKASPKELKLLSDTDEQEGLRFHIPVIQFYKHEASMKGRDPVTVISDAVAEMLIFHYPLAGRLRELGGGAGRKVVVDCAGKGVLFVEAEANADISLKDSGDALQPPFPCLEELLLDLPQSGGFLQSPL
ncbi:Transferase [Trema orientale]|uniref:Transferase n=1 Tax=Trema orientale TaxID=63057 RepID=A0A2P5DD12_TREOI|nr:Transferase [Trema orientale]